MAQAVVSSVMVTCQKKTIEMMRFLGDTFRGVIGSLFANKTKRPSLCGSSASPLFPPPWSARTSLPVTEVNQTTLSLYITL